MDKKQANKWTRNRLTNGQETGQQMGKKQANKWTRNRLTNGHETG